MTDTPKPGGSPPEAPKPATAHTCAHNHGVAGALPFHDTQDFEDARRGFVATLPDVEITNATGQVVWSLKQYAFLAHEAAPDTVNPSLWRQARLNMNNGLFQVTDRIYQIRGFDLSNMTVIEGARGLIVIDPMISTETARAGLELYFTHRGRRPVTAVIYTHSHVDHYGGVRGVIDEADVEAGHVMVIAPDRFLEEVTSENVIAGGPMVRRALFQFGALLPPGERGQVDAGLGKVTSRGTVTLIPPSHVIREPLETHVVDGVEIIFQLAPDTEAKAEMHMFYPGLKALNLAENATHNLHNVYPIRGAQVRDALAWSKYLDRARADFAPHADVVFAQHHWPVWGDERIQHYLARQRDAYKYLHDQTVRLLSHGLKPDEIADRIAFPRSLDQDWSVRGYYGTLRHNAKAIYQRYLGWYDANPANLDPHPPAERAARTLRYMGGADPVIAKARADFAAGDYRWVADVMSQVVFAEPDNTAARALAADAFEQLGYQAESATWRNAYLFGAVELRHGPPQIAMRAPVSPDVVGALSVELLFDYLGVRLNGPKADGVTAVINWTFTDMDTDTGTDTGETGVSTLTNGTLTYLSGAHNGAAAATVTITRAALTALVTRQTSLEEAVDRGRLEIEGDRSALPTLLSLIDDFPFFFPVIEPQRRVDTGP
ncbi:MAG: alkyl/aryl-sulfatase [Alphaproteobacteria bacterium]